MASPNLLAQEWYEGTGIVTIANITPEEARSQAFDKARVDALAKARLEVTGITWRQVSEGAGGTSYDNFIQFIRTRTKGLIVEIDTLSDSTELLSFGDGPPILSCRVSVNALIELETGDPDPSFILSLDLNRETFRNGETMIIELTATKDCYVTVFNLYSNDSLRIVFPNQLYGDNSLKTGSSLFIPPPDAFWDLPVGLAVGKDQDQEVLLAVAVKDPIPFQNTLSVVRNGLIAQSDALIAVNKWLAQIDADQRTEAWFFYQIVK